MGFIASNSVGSISSSNSTNYPFIKEWEGKILEKTPLIPESKISREINIHTDKLVNLYWGDQSIPFWSINNQVFIDQSTATSLSIEPLDGETNVKILIRSVKQITYDIGGLMIPTKVRLAIGTGANFIDVNAGSYNSPEYQYLVNLQKLKNSNSGVTGWKLFDVFSFYPGKSIDFSVSIDGGVSNNYQPDSIAVQVFDPIVVGEVLFGVANDVVNLEFGNIGDNFIGNLTRDAFYSEVLSNKFTISPDYSRHVGRFVAISNETGKYDTAIIKSYVPDPTNKFIGGTFILTGDF